MFHPNGFIKKVLGDGFCVIRAFQEGLSICYNENHKLCDVKAALRSEILRNFDEYSAFSCDKVNVLTELDRFLANLLQYYNSDTVDLFLIALENSYACNTIVYRCTEKDTWTTNISNPEKHYTKTLYFAMTDKDHVDLVLNTDDQRVESDRQDNRISSGSDSDIEITKYVSPLRSRRSGFKGDRFMVQCKGSFQCSNPHCRHVVQYNRFNRRQFTPKGICKSCGNLCERQKCDAMKIFEFPEEKLIHVVTIKQFGIHLCAPIKPKGKRDIKEIIASNPNKVSKAKRDILYTMICEGANFEDIEDRASKLMDRKILNKIKASDNQPEFAQLINVRERYIKNDKFLIYRMNNQPTFVFKTSSISLEIAENMTRGKNHYLSNVFACFDGNEKRTKRMTVLTLSMYHPLLRKQIILATMDCESENKDNCELFWRTWSDALADFQAGLIFDPTGVILDERGCNWNALKEVYGEDFITRCSSCEFHFKQSVNRRLNETVFLGEKSADRFR